MTYRAAPVDSSPKDTLLPAAPPPRAYRPCNARRQVRGVERPRAPHTPQDHFSHRVCPMEQPLWHGSSLTLAARSSVWDTPPTGSRRGTLGEVRTH
jgi:hypothetical protein